MAKKETQSDTLKKEKAEQKDLSLKKTAMVQAMEKTLGVVTTASRSIGIHRSTHYEWYNTDPEYKILIDDLENVALDFAESQLHSQIKDGNTSATIFYLKTKGKKRGYIERIETEELGNREPIEIHIIDPMSEAEKLGEDPEQEE